MSDSGKTRKFAIDLTAQPAITADEFEQLQNTEQIDLLIMSDTHGRDEYAAAALKMKPSAKIILHLGDHVSDISRLRSTLGCPILGVRGNCDGFGRNTMPEILEFDLAGCHIVMTHGHNKCFSVKRSLAKLRDFALRHKHTPALILYGHTHIYHEEIIQKDNKEIRMLNPGSSAYGISAIYVSLNSGKIVDVTRLTRSP